FTTPAAPTITQNGNVLTCSPASSYQWQLNAVDIPGATNQSYTVTQNGLYTVIVGDENGCVNSASLSVDVTGMTDLAGENIISIFPNPSNGNFFIEISDCSENNFSIEILNALGKSLWAQNIVPLHADCKSEINLENFPPGIYILEIKTENTFLKKKIIISN